MNKDKSHIRVRFAPSPTGHLHVGGARTALYNYLYARKTGGKFILRIEDTDVKRSTEESYEGIIDAMEWLGLESDEGPLAGGDYGPYTQSGRNVLYHNEVRKLLDAGKAYYCFCTPERLKEMRFEMEEKKLPAKYDGRCRKLSESEVEERLSKGVPHVIRFKMPSEGNVFFRDIVRGKFTFDNANLDDFVLIKSDGKPTYNFAVVVDDAHMKISHVIRGDDHISNTPRQVSLYHALGYKVPKFAHLPMILGRDRARLSKRHGATSIAYYRKRHYLAEGLLNYLALLGWSLDGKRELFTRKALIDKFSLKKVSKNPAVFDNDKMEWINSEHLKKISLVGKISLVQDVLDEEGLIPPEFDVDITKPVDLKIVPEEEDIKEEKIRNYKMADKEIKRLGTIINVLGNRLKLLKDVPDIMGYFYTDNYSVDEEAVRTHLLRSEVPDRMNKLADEFEKLKYFDRESVEKALRDLAFALEITAGELIHPCRVALTGKIVSPDIFWVVILLGKNKTVERLRNAAELYSSI
ncbi:MAG: glutamate--tRNA ligase [Candidatus Krumholzibacteriota bacterium]|nr:glutamate--tRNA ligase [Candidatus Krumholzibacteriota bacterium]